MHAIVQGMDRFIKKKRSSNFWIFTAIIYLNKVKRFQNVQKL